MTDTSLEKLVPEQDFGGLLENHTQLLFRLANSLLEAGKESWTKRHYFELYTESDEVESFLDDYGARTNRTYNYFTEVVASVRGISLAGLSLEHLGRRIEAYGVVQALDAKDAQEALADLTFARAFVQSTLCDLLSELKSEAGSLSLAPPQKGFSQDSFDEGIQRFSLPRNLGQEDLQDETQKIAEVASKYLQACQMLDEAGVRRIDDEKTRETYLRQHCTEEHARVYEATVHNLQSAYDTYIKNTVIESKDERLPRLRGHVSCTLHLLEAVTHLTHFVDRHEGEGRTEAAEQRLGQTVNKARIRALTLNHLLHWAYRFMDHGRALAEELLPSYTNVLTLEVQLGPDLSLHARPASLIVTIVNRYGTPVEMEVASHTCNAGSILELMIAVGSNPDARKYTFRGDENPLRDIALLFEAGLGEDGMDSLPEALSYLVGGA